MQLGLGRGSLRLAGPVPGQARIAWEPASWRRDGAAHTLRSSGRIDDLPLGWADLLLAGSGSSLANLDLAGNLVFGGSWNVQADRGPLRVQAVLERRSGDIAVLGVESTTGRIPAGVREARLAVAAEGEQLRATLDWASENAGEISAELATRLDRSGGAWAWPDSAPLSGRLQARLPRVGAWSLLAPPGWRMRGTLQADARIGGTRADPQWNGSLRADDLALRSAVEGIELTDGRLRAQLEGRRLALTEFSLRGAPVAGGAPTSGGRLQASGSAEWVPGSGIRSDVQLQAQALRVSVRTDRRLTVSGDLRAQTEGQALAVRGTLRADQALFVLPDESAPTLGSDVVVTSGARRAEGAGAAARAAGASGTPSTARPVDLAVAFDLGDDFRVQGRGLDTRLAGTLNLASGARAGQPMRVTGELRTVRGSYRAYGQALNIEQGVLRFAGAYDNPALDVLAIRPYLSQRVGVQITGSALAPRIRLYAEPELPDSEKLAWLVLGRSAASGGAESALLQQAALALLGGNNKGLSGGLAQALGLDELSFRGATDNAGGAAVTFGKRLARNFYVSYERSLAGTMGTFFVFYELTRRLTLRAQTGEQSAVDLIFTVPYD